MTLQDPAQVRKQAEFDRLMTAANVHRRRGDYAQAALSVKEALGLFPDSLDAREFAADMLFAHGSLEKAADEYKRISEEDKSRASAEEKYATAILQIAEGKRQQDLLKGMLENPSKFQPPGRSPILAALISTAPGFGQIYCGQLVKGIVLFAASMLFWILFYLCAPNVSSYPAAARIQWFFKELSAPAVAFACLAVFTHIYAFVDAPVLAGKLQEAEKAANAPDAK